MFDPPNLLEQRHFELNSALGRLDAEKVRAVLAAEPLSAQPMAGWRSSPLQTLVSQGYLLTNEKLEPWTQCLLALVKAGADINQGHGYGSSPIQTLLGQGNHRAISILAQVGALGRLLEDGVRGQAALLSVFRAQHGGGMAEHSYPLSAMVRVLLEVGANAAGNASSYGEQEEGPSILHGIFWMVGSAQLHPQFEEACGQLIEAGAKVGSIDILRAFNNNHDKIAGFLISHCDITSEEIMAQTGKSMKPQRVAALQDMLLRRRVEPTQTPDRRGPRL
jgi:hypothetical protein